MLFAVVTSMIVGLVSARAIVAESDAHRRELPDNWYSPECVDCGGSLSVSLIRCRPERHRQRSGNLWIQILTVVVFGAVAATIGSLWLLPAYLWFAWFSILLTVTDLDTKLIPNRILLPGTIGGVILLTVGSVAAGEPSYLIRAALAGIIYFLGMMLLAMIAKGALGLGDVKLAFLLGIFTGYLGWGELVIASLGGFILGGLISLLLLVTRVKGRKDAIPFGPFMTLGAIIAVVFGEQIIAWYIG